MFNDMEHTDGAGTVTATAQQLDMTCLERMVVFVGENGRMPTVGEGPAEESVLGRWLASQQSAAASGSMNPARRAVLDAAVPGWMPPTEAVWLDKARDCADFIITEGRLPGIRGSEVERQLAGWFKTQLAVARHGSMPAELQGWLEDHMPAWVAIARRH
ncbi:helicase associated domain-containing protein (plasmid) [Citricoccus nitrophenolicus]